MQNTAGDGCRADPNDGYFSHSRLALPEVDHQTDHQTEGLQRSDPDALARDTPLDLREWTNPDSVRPAPWDWKSCDLQGSVGSNPTSSAHIWRCSARTFDRLFRKRATGSVSFVGRQLTHAHTESIADAPMTPFPADP